MTGAARFQALGAISVQLTNVFRETRSLSRQSCRRRLPALAVALLLSSPAMGDQRDSLTIGITQFPSTLNPNIDAMAAKSYVLGMALRPFTVYDADWRLVCLLCVTLPSIENGLAVPVDLADGKKGVDLTYTIRPEAKWGDGDRRQPAAAPAPRRYRPLFAENVCQLHRKTPQALESERFRSYYRAPMRSDT